MYQEKDFEEPTARKSVKADCLYCQRGSSHIVWGTYGPRIARAPLTGGFGGFIAFGGFGGFGALGAFDL